MPDFPTPEGSLLLKKVPESAVGLPVLAKPHPLAVLHRLPLADGSQHPAVQAVVGNTSDDSVFEV
jgi:hypothetical protein